MNWNYHHVMIFHFAVCCFLPGSCWSLGGLLHGKKTWHGIFHRVTPWARFTLTHFSKYSKAWHYGYGMIHDDLEWLPSPLDHIKSVLYGFPKSFPINMPPINTKSAHQGNICSRSLIKKKVGLFKVLQAGVDPSKVASQWSASKIWKLAINLHLVLF